MSTIQDEHHTCDECGSAIHLYVERAYREGSYKQVRKGMCLDFSGGHDEFNDVTNDFLMGAYPEGYVALCHDCTVRVWEAIPNAVARFGVRRHMTLTETPCCRWSWKWRTMLEYDGEKIVARDRIIMVPNADCTDWVPVK